MDGTVAGKLTDKALEIDTVLGDKMEKLDNEKSTRILEQIHEKIKSKQKSKIRTLIS